MQAERVQQMMKEKKISVKAMAEALDMDVSTYYRKMQKNGDGFNAVDFDVLVVLHFSFSFLIFHFKNPPVSPSQQGVLFLLRQYFKAGTAILEGITIFKVLQMHLYVEST